MPNHTDCRIHIIGDEKSLTPIISGFRILALGDIPGSRPAEDPLKDPKGFWSHLCDGRSWRGAPEPSTADILCGDEPSFSFELASPMPKSLHVEDGSTGAFGTEILYGNWAEAVEKRFPAEVRSSISSQAEAVEWMEANDPKALSVARIWRHNEENYGHRSWYQWSISNWGTKWDAYDASWRKTNPKGGELVVHFNTAWSPPIPAIADLCQKFGVRAIMGYVDEGGGFAGYSEFAPDGDVSDSQNYDRSSAMWADMRRRVKAAKSETPVAADGEEAPTPTKLPVWMRNILRGKPLSARDAKSFSEPIPDGFSSADALASCLAPGPLVESQGLLPWIEAVHAAGIVKPSDLTLSGEPLGLLLCQSAWEPGVRWAAKHAAPQDFTAWAQFGLLGALRHNAPKATQLFVSLLDADHWPNFSDPEIFQLATEACSALAADAKTPTAICEALETAASLYMESDKSNDSDFARVRAAIAPILARREERLINTVMAPGVPRKTPRA